MTLDLSGLQQKFDNTLETIDNFVEYVRKLGGQKGYVQFEYWTKDGQLKKSNTPTIPQLIEQFRQGVNSQMAKTVYVHQQEGSDTTGNGSQNAPFATPDKAVESIPPGGFGIIYLAANQVHEFKYSHELRGKTIIFTQYGATNPKQATLRNKAFINSQGANETTGVITRNGFVAFNHLRIETTPKLDPNLNWSEWVGLIKRLDNSTPRALFYNCEIVLNSDLVRIPAGPTTLTEVAFYNCNIIRNSGFVINNEVSSPILLKSAGTSITDSAGNNLAWTDVIAGIIRDPNGTPRNVISNLVL